VRQILSSIIGAIVGIGRKINLWCTRFDQWFMKLRYWQRGAIIGGGGHLVLVLFLFVLALIFVPLTSGSGGDMGTPTAWILFILYWLIEFIPFLILNLFFRLDVSLLETFSNPRTIWMWALYMIYSTLLYTLVGMAVAKSIEFLRKPAKRNHDDKHER